MPNIGSVRIPSFHLRPLAEWIRCRIRCRFKLLHARHETRVPDSSGRRRLLHGVATPPRAEWRENVPGMLGLYLRRQISRPELTYNPERSISFCLLGTVSSDLSTASADLSNNAPINLTLPAACDDASCGSASHLVACGMWGRSGAKLSSPDFASNLASIHQSKRHQLASILEGQDLNG